MRCDFVSRIGDETSDDSNGKESGMPNKNLNETSRTDKAAGCGCAQASNGRGCPCKKRICLPVAGLVGIAIVISLAAKRRHRR